MMEIRKTDEYAKLIMARMPVYKKQGREVIIRLAGGDKRSQASDIKTALRLAHNL